MCVSRQMCVSSQYSTNEKFVRLTITGHTPLTECHEIWNQRTNVERRISEDFKNSFQFQNGGYFVRFFHSYGLRVKSTVHRITNIIVYNADC